MEILVTRFFRIIRVKQFLPIALMFFLAACSKANGEGNVNEGTPTNEAPLIAQATLTDVPAMNTIVPTRTNISPTNTLQPTSSPTLEPTATFTLEPTATNTLEPTATNTLEPTATNTIQPTATNTVIPTIPPPTAVLPESTLPPSPPHQPTNPPEPILGLNLIPNGSFEEGHYNQDGVPELQLPVKWRIAWDEGPTGIGNATWDVYVRPEVSVLSTARLPPSEHALYIFNGQHTVKIFKGQGAVNFRLSTDVLLEPGTYVVEAKMFADIVERWENGQKVWAQDPHAAEFRFLVGDGGTFWTTQRFGQINVHNFTFTVDETKNITVSLAMRGRYAIANNGWFIDDLSLRRIE